MNLIEEYPLKVAYPESGVRYLLGWTTHNEGGHVIIGKSGNQISVAAIQIIQKYWDRIEFGKYLRVEMVSPGIESQRIYAENSLVEDMERFWSTIVYKSKKCLEKTGKLPSGLLPCPKYETDKEMSPEEIEENIRWDHCECKRCGSGSIILVSGTKKELYFQHLDWFKRTRRRFGPELSLPRARIIREGELLHGIRWNPGHHCSGATMTSETLTPSVAANGNYLCFYVPQEELDTSEFVSYRKVLIEKWKTSTRERKEKEKQDEDRRDLAEVTSFLEEFSLPSVRS